MLHMKRRVGAALTVAMMAALPAMAEPDLTLLTQAMEGNKIDHIDPSPVEGLHEFNVGSEVFYLSSDGRYLIRGELIDLQSRENLTENNRARARADLLNSVDKKDLIIFPATGGDTKHAVYIFTDIDCGYCRMLHENIDGYNENGIEVRYLAFPRAGIGSESYDKAVAVWCSEDRNTALTDAKNGDSIESNNCASPVRDQYNLGISIGVNGTPAIILEDGTLIPGFVKPDNLAAILAEHDELDK